MSQKQNKNSSPWLCKVPGTVVCDSGTVSLFDLVEQLDSSLLPNQSKDCRLNCITIDSRKVSPGSLFIALPGRNVDGHTFVAAAVEQGCSALLVERNRIDATLYTAQGLLVIEVPDSRQIYGALAAQLYGYPAREVTLFGVTGTNGKTSISYLLESVLQQAGRQTGVLGTINYRYSLTSGKVLQRPSPFTTPEPLLLQQTLREMVDCGVQNVIMEISSHGLEQNRLGDLLFDVVAFSNLSRDHLDYHSDMEHYFLAKMRLFQEHLGATARAIITFSDAECSFSGRVLEWCRENDVSHLSCGAGEERDISVLANDSGIEGTEISLEIPDGQCRISSPLLGSFNILNLQTTFAMAQAAGIETDTICMALKTATGAPGRMERVTGVAGEEGLLPTVLVDYAHTPDALEQVLKVLHDLPHRRLYCVFGCGGDRDRGKRSIMGGIAEKYADVIIICSDNPRTEDPQQILDDIAIGITTTPHSGAWFAENPYRQKVVVRIGHRRMAIAAAIDAAGADDIVLIAGKGHEEYQITKEGKHFFDDRLEAVEALEHWRLESLLRATAGKPAGTENSCKGLGAIHTDSRTMAKGDIFLALSGERFDGHDYIKQVVAAGAAALILERIPESVPPVPIVVVADTERALGDLARYRRSRMRKVSNPTVIGITGSSGKTTVKEMCGAIFAKRWPEQDDAPARRILKTEGNFNNLIGLPLSLLPLVPKQKAVILEMGMNAPGEIARLTEIADPDIACIINVHGAHLQGLGTIEGVAKAKAELFRGCSQEALLVMNADDPLVVALALDCKQKKISFGLLEGADEILDVAASNCTTGSDETVCFNLHIEGQREECVLQVPGMHNISNALAAATIAWGAGIGIRHIIEGLNSFQAAERRMEIVAGPGDCRVINDSYNANPQSMEAGINTLSGLGSGIRIAILGDMLELGPESIALHQDLGHSVARHQIDRLAVIGEFAEATAGAARERGMEPDSVQVFADRESCLLWLKRLIERGEIGGGSYILVKGSRGMQLDKLVERFVGEQ